MPGPKVHLAREIDPQESDDGPLDLNFIRSQLSRGMSQREIAQRLGIDRNRIQRLMARQRAVQVVDPAAVTEAVQALLQRLRTRPRLGYRLIHALKSQLKRNIADLLALSDQNDPYYAGTPSKQRNAQWFADLWQRFQFPVGVHLRRIHYRVVSVETPILMPDGMPYQNTESCWDFMQKASKPARYLGLVDAGAFEDHRNPDPHIYMPEAEERESLGVLLSLIERWTLPTIRSDLSTLLHLDLPMVAQVTGYDYAPADQPSLVEVWIEKSTMDDVLEPICQRLHVNLVTSIGFQSISNAIKVLRRLQQFDKPTRILYISDFDPAGDSMPVAMARQLEYWLQEYAPGCDIKLTQLALTRQQVVRYRLPRIPIKAADLRRAGFEERYGEGAVELDALEALYPGRLAEIVEEAILPYRDLTLDQRLSEVSIAADAEAQAVWDDEIGDLQEELDTLRGEIEAVISGYEPRLATLNRDLQRDLRPFRLRADRLWQEAQERAERFDPELPERPEPDTEEVDEDEWLFDSQRDYLTQLDDHYKARKAVPKPGPKKRAPGPKKSPRK